MAILILVTLTALRRLLRLSVAPGTPRAPAAPSPRLCDVLPRFAAELQGEGATVQTVARYCRILRAFGAWLDPDATLADIDAPFIRTYQGLLVERRQAIRTVRQSLSAIRALCRWAIRAQLRTDDPTLDVRWPRTPKSLPRPLTAAELYQLAAILRTPRRGKGRSLWTWQRNHRAICLMLYGGLRLGEVCRLDWQHVDLGRGVLYVVQGKGRKDRVVPLHPELARVLAVIPATQCTGAVAGNRDGSGQGEKTMGHLCMRWLAQLGLDGITAHRLRYTCATELRRNGADLKDVQAILGHESLETTEYYLGPDPDRLCAAIRHLPLIEQMGRARPDRRRAGLRGRRR
jgi:site-specific recombinase XerD